MGFLDRLKGKAPIRDAADGRIEVGAVMLRGGDTVPVVGESHYQDELDRICGGRCEDGHHREVVAVLMAEPSNPYDHNAVAVYVESVKIGHLSRDDALAYKTIVADLARRNMLGACRAVIAGGWDRGGGDIGHYGVKLDLAAPDHAHPDSPPPPPGYPSHGSPRSTPSPRRPAGGGVHTGASQRSQTSAGLVEGRHYTEWVDTVKDLKRLGQYDAAADLLARLCDAAEAESIELGQTLPPWYFEQAAIVARKQRRHGDEIAVLERYSRSPHAQPAQFDERLAKARSRKT